VNIIYPCIPAALYLSSTNQKRFMHFPPYRFSKILIIDDSIIDSMMNEYILTQSKFAKQVVAKYSSDDAIAYLVKHSASGDELPQLIFLDLKMPEKDGFHFLNEFSRLDLRIKRSMAVIVLSSSIDAIDYSRAVSNPYVINFLKKPLNVEELMHIKI
jgi:response regulator RpfG family c-di-GMP phosphodiesterase